MSFHIFEGPSLNFSKNRADGDDILGSSVPRRAWGTASIMPVTNPLERVNGEIKRRTEVVVIFPNEAAITRLVGAILLEQNDEWAVQRARYITLETIAPLRDDLTLMLPAAAASAKRTEPAFEILAAQLLHHAQGHDLGALF
jgi:hypothetical protein